MAADRRRYNRTIDGNVAYDLNYQRNTVPVPDGGQPYPVSYTHLTLPTT